jgi:hypothetical protein
MTETSLGKSRRCSEAVQPLWPRARPGKRLRANEIHIWSACLTRPEGVRVPFLETLSAEERERAARFHFHQDQRRWIICRGVLRTLLGSYLDLEPARIRFREGEYGKPQLQSAPPPSPPSVSPPREVGAASRAAPKAPLGSRGLQEPWGEIQRGQFFPQDRERRKPLKKEGIAPDAGLIRIRPRTYRPIRFAVFPS